MSLKLKIRWVLILLATLIVLVFTAVNYREARALALDDIDSRLTTAAASYRFITGKGFHDNLVPRAQADLKKMRQLSESLTHYAKEAGVPYVYAFVLRDGKPVYVLSGLSDEEMAKPDVESYLQPYESYNDGLKAAFSTKTRQFFEYADSYGSFRSVYLPFISGSGETIVAVADAKLDDVHARLNALLFHSLIVGALLIIIATAASFWLSNLVVRPLEALLLAVQKLSSGEADLTVRLPANDKDETGRIAGAFNQFVAELHRLIRIVQDQTRQLAHGVTEIGNVTTQLSDEARAQTNLAASSAATIEEVTVSIGHMAEHAYQVEATVNQADASAQDSSAAMHNMDSANQQMAGTMQELGSAMSSLAEESRQITQILSTIKDIAGQTNLLALNAAIEAARAGEQGRGFAVVADEVRKLAERTTSSTVEIDRLLNSITTQTNNAVGRMESATETVEKNHALVSDIVGRFAGMQTDMRSAASQVSEISDATREQRVATEQIAQVAERINHQAAETEAALSRTRSTLGELAALGNTLQDVVQRFRL